MPERSSSAVRFGMAMRPLSVSDISHISAPEPAAPATHTAVKMSLYTNMTVLLPEER